jgi:spore coat protein U-like protein
MNYFHLTLIPCCHSREAQSRQCGVRAYLIVAVLLPLMNMLTPATAKAQGPKCTFTMSNISFGVIDVSSGKTYDATATFTYACTGDAREIIRICPSYGVPEGSSRWITDSSGHKLMYNIYTDPERSTIWGTWHSKSTKGPSIDIPVGRGERVSGSVTAYARTDPDQQSVPPGSYNGAINGNNTAIVYGYTSAGSCESLKNGPKDHLGFSITANVRTGGAGNTQGSTQNQAEPPPRVDYTNDSRGRSSRNDNPRPADKMETCTATSPGATLNSDNGPRLHRCRLFG